MSSRLDTPLNEYAPNEADPWLMWQRNYRNSKWVPVIAYSQPGKPPHVDSGVEAHSRKQLIPTEHLGKTLKELSEIYPAPEYVSEIECASKT